MLSQAEKWREEKKILKRRRYFDFLTQMLNKKANSVCDKRKEKQKSKVRKRKENGENHLHTHTKICSDVIKA